MSACGILGCALGYTPGDTRGDMADVRLLLVGAVLCVACGVIGNVEGEGVWAVAEGGAGAAAGAVFRPLPWPAPSPCRHVRNGVTPWFAPKVEANISSLLSRSDNRSNKLLLFGLCLVA